jgi:ribosome recycling factor
MTEELDIVFESTEESMNKAIKHFESELLKIRAGKATPSMLDSVFVDYYGSSTPINQVANVNTPDAKTILVQPWEKNMLESIEKAIINSNLGFNPQNNGENIIISIPPLTEERRRDLFKNAKTLAEDARVSIRSARKDANDEIKTLQKEGLPEDMAKKAETDIQDMTNKYNAKIDEILDKKEKDIMHV